MLNMCDKYISHKRVKFHASTTRDFKMLSSVFDVEHVQQVVSTLKL